MYDPVLLESQVREESLVHVSMGLKGWRVGLAMAEDEIEHPKKSSKDQHNLWQSKRRYTWYIPITRGFDSQPRLRVFRRLRIPYAACKGLARTAVSAPRAAASPPDCLLPSMVPSRSLVCGGIQH